MAQAVTARNLSTGVERVYVGLSPCEAIVAAWEQTRGNYNTWDYPGSKAPIMEGELTWSTGDWVCFKRGGRRCVARTETP